MDLKLALDRQREFFLAGGTKPLTCRKEALKSLKRAIKDNEEALFASLYVDLGKSSFEAYETEVGIVYEEISFMLKHMDSLAKPRRVHTPVTIFPGKSLMYREPYGTVLIMSPWNYPFQLTMMPLVGALATGNCAVVKPSNYSPETSKVMAKIIKEAFSEEYVFTVLGGREANQDLLEHHFDFIFFTGGKAVGRTVMEAASKNLTPVTLELGGKSPCIIDKTANIDMAARRIVWGKFLNCGQTCVAPDYVLIDKSIREQFIAKAIKYIEALYGDDPLLSKDYPKIINEKHFDRLLGLIESGSLRYGGSADKLKLKIHPTILSDVTWDSPVMGQEIFGPILPIIDFEDLSEVKKIVEEHPKPLALYFFTKSKKAARFILKNLSFGGGCINDTIMHLANNKMPFGGVGESGMGNYHGRFSFDTFSHTKSILRKGNIVDVPIRYAPYKESLWLLKKLMK